MNDSQRQILLKVARDAVLGAITGHGKGRVECDDPELQAHCGCFVTLKSDDQLRGCIGRFTSDKPLLELVAEMAIASATEDPRFSANRISADEFDSLDIEISVLSPLRRTEDPLSLRLGIDGIYIKRGYNSGCFLPQVATETGWSRQEFLSYCCLHKANMEPNAWKDPLTEVYFFTAEVFGAAFKDID
ncbi:MAG: AmmeMemoRadiSam system protein A [Planctomycetota bacterium]